MKPVSAFVVIGCITERRTILHAQVIMEGLPTLGDCMRSGFPDTDWLLSMQCSCYLVLSERLGMWLLLGGSRRLDGRGLALEDAANDRHLVASRGALRFRLLLCFLCRERQQHRCQRRFEHGAFFLTERRHISTKGTQKQETCAPPSMPLTTTSGRTGMCTGPPVIFVRGVDAGEARICFMRAICEYHVKALEDVPCLWFARVPLFVQIPSA